MIRVTPLFSLGDEQARRGCCAFPEGCRVTDADTNWGSAVSGWNGHMQNSHTWAHLFIIAASYKMITTRSCLCIMHYTLYNKSQGDTVQANKKQWYLKAKYTLNKYMDVLFYRAFFLYWKGIKTLRCPVFVAQFLQLKFSMLWLFLFVCLQVTMMVLCQCSQRCSWCAKREDYSYQAPPLLSVRFNFNLPAYVLLVCRANPVKC